MRIKNWNDDDEWESVSKRWFIVIDYESILCCCLKNVYLVSFRACIINMELNTWEIGNKRIKRANKNRNFLSRVGSCFSCSKIIQSKRFTVSIIETTLSPSPFSSSSHGLFLVPRIFLFSFAFLDQPSKESKKRRSKNAKLVFTAHPWNPFETCLEIESVFRQNRPRISRA